MEAHEEQGARLQPQAHLLHSLQLVALRTTFQHTDLTQCISHLPHKIVNLLFELVIVNNKLTILLGS